MCISSGCFAGDYASIFLTWRITDCLYLTVLGLRWGPRDLWSSCSKRGVQLGKEGSPEPPLRPSACEEEPQWRRPAPPSPRPQQGQGVPPLWPRRCAHRHSLAVSSWIPRRNWLCYWSPRVWRPCLYRQKASACRDPWHQRVAGLPLVTVGPGPAPTEGVGGVLGRMPSWRVGRRLPSLPPDVTARPSPDWSPPVTRSALPLMAGLGSAVGLEQGAGDNSPALTRSHSPDRALESRVGIVYITTK